jgi:pyridoxine kinase
MQGSSFLMKRKRAKMQGCLIYATATRFKAGAAAVFLKGESKLPDAVKAVDLFYDGKTFEILESPLIKTNWTHGAGYTTSAAIAAGLARGLPVYDAVTLAKKFIMESLAGSFALNVGSGNPCAWRKETLFK